MFFLNPTLALHVMSHSSSDSTQQSFRSGHRSVPPEGFVRVSKLQEGWDGRTTGEDGPEKNGERWTMQPDKVISL